MWAEYSKIFGKMINTKDVLTKGQNYLYHVNIIDGGRKIIKKDLDKIFQNAVDFEANKLYKSSIENIINRNDYGSIETIEQGIKISIGWWKHKFNENLYHIVFKSGRKLFLCFYRSYLNGVKVVNGNIEYLSDIELCDYD